LLCLGRVLTGKGKFVWTGDTCDPERFASFLDQKLKGARKQRGVLSIAELVNASYTELRLSHLAFARLLEGALTRTPGKYDVSGSIALPASRENVFDCLTRPNADAFLRHVNLEDGLVIGRKTIKAISLHT